MHLHRGVRPLRGSRTSTGIASRAASGCGRAGALIHPTSTPVWPPLRVDGAMIIRKRAALRGANGAQAAACLALQLYVQFLNAPLDSTNLRVTAARLGFFARGRNARTPRRSGCARPIAWPRAHGAASESATARSALSAPHSFTNTPTAPTRLRSNAPRGRTGSRLPSML